MKKRLILILTIVLACSMIFTVSCKKKATQEDYDKVKPVDNPEDYDPESGLPLLPEGNGIVYPEEADGSEPQFQKEETSKFVGEWEATSDMANQLYGNVDITINEDHTWSGNITDEDFSDKWVETDTGIEIKVGVYDIGLAFDDNGTLIMTRYGQDGEDDIHTVLTRKNSDESTDEGEE